MSDETPTVFVVDDDPSHLASVARLLRAAGFHVAPFSSAPEFLHERAPDAPGCLVADLEMPEMNGIELQEALSESENPLPVVFLTGQGDIPTSVAAMRSGAEDFLTKHAPMEDLLGAIRRALERDARDRDARHRRQELRGRFDTLTPREREVLMHVLSGQLNKQIASDLGVNERSVKRHRSSIMAKVGAQSVAELTRLALEVGIKA